MGTTLNDTGQRLDVTGLLYYHARYSNPVLARCISADTRIPGEVQGDAELRGMTVEADGSTRPIGQSQEALELTGRRARLNGWMKMLLCPLKRKIINPVQMEPDQTLGPRNLKLRS